MRTMRLSFLLVALVSSLMASQAFGKVKGGGVTGGTEDSVCPYNISCSNGSSASCCNSLDNCCNACEDLCGGTCGGLC